MQLIGLTGGIASGKSLVSGRLAELGAVVIDADRVAREVVEPGTPGLAAIREHFGDRVIAADGSLDRPALGAIVFADEAERQVLNGITHPAVWRETRARIDAARAADADAIVVYDVPLLVEGRSARQLEFDLIVVVHATETERIRRMVEDRGMERAEAERRIRAQATEEERLAIADVVVDNTGTREAALAEVDALWQRLTAG